MSLTCTYQDLHNIDVWRLPVPTKEGECNMSTLPILFETAAVALHLALTHAGLLNEEMWKNYKPLNYLSFLTSVESWMKKEGVIKYLGKGSTCQFDGSRHHEILEDDNFRNKLSQDKARWWGNARKDALLRQLFSLFRGQILLGSLELIMMWRKTN